MTPHASIDVDRAAPHEPGSLALKAGQAVVVKIRSGPTRYLRQAPINCPSFLSHTIRKPDAGRSDASLASSSIMKPITVASFITLG